MIIDFHTHVFPPSIVQNREDYLYRDELFRLLYAGKNSKLATTADLISNMDDQGIQRSVILNIAWNSQEICRQTNDYILESIARYPNRLIGFCMVKFDSQNAAILEIERCKKSGIKGIGEIRPSCDILKQNSTLHPIIDYIVEQNLILLTHTSEPIGPIYPGKGEITPQTLYPLITSNTNLKLVCAHWGGGLPFYALMPKVNPFFKNLYFDSAASPFLYQPQIYSLVTQSVGLEKILFGSDYPLLSPQRLLTEIENLNISLSAKNAILAGNAIKLLDMSSE
jgi:predicted TIM-barrel fold metal-dependent hydrolase